MKKEQDKALSNDLFKELSVKAYLNLNGKTIPADEPSLLSSNRSFRYGDALFETIRIANGKILFLAEHIKRLTNSMRFLKMENRQEFSVGLLGQQMADLSLKNGIKTDGRIRLTVFRNQNGQYTPEINSVSYLIEVEKINEKGFVLNPKGYSIDIFSELRKSHNKLSNIKSANALIYVLAGIYKKEKMLDDCIILNESGGISEAISSNIFAVKDKTVFTPPLNEACIDGIMRQKVIKIAKECKLTVYETPLLPDFLQEADEVFFTNAIQGIRWAMAFKIRRYYNNTSKLLLEKLNEYVR